MRRVSSGYTLVEIIIVLAITGVLLMSSIYFISNSEGNNRFSQSMHDTQSKIQDWINDIPTGYGSGTRQAAGNVDNLRCVRKLIGSAYKPYFEASGSAGANDDANCIYLGRAIQFTNNPKGFFVPGYQTPEVISYSVFGLRSITVAGDERPVANLEEASPNAAVGDPLYSGYGNLTEHYKIPGHARIKSIMESSGVTAGGSNAYMAGFYLSFNPQKDNTSGSASVRAYQYPRVNANAAGDYLSDNSHYNVLACISQNIGSTCDKPPAVAAEDWLPKLTTWKICFDNNYNDNTAILTISSDNGSSVTTKLEFTPC